MSKINIPREEFMIEKIACFEMGDHGTCTSLIKEFKLR